MESIAFLFGGVTELELVLAFVILLVTAVALGTVGIYFSALMERTLVANVRAYSVILTAMFIAPVVLTTVFNLINDLLIVRSGAPISPLLELITNYIDLLLVSINPVAAGLSTQSLLVDQQVVGFYAYTLRSDGSTIPLVSPWISFTIIYLAISAVIIILTIQRTKERSI